MALGSGWRGRLLQGGEGQPGTFSSGSFWTQQGKAIRGQRPWVQAEAAPGGVMAYGIIYVGSPPGSPTPWSHLPPGVTSSRNSLHPSLSLRKRPGDPKQRLLCPRPPSTRAVCWCPDPMPLLLSCGEHFSSTSSSQSL